MRQLLTTKNKHGEEIAQIDHTLAQAWACEWSSVASRLPIQKPSPSSSLKTIPSLTLAPCFSWPDQCGRGDGETKPSRGGSNCWLGQMPPPVTQQVDQFLHLNVDVRTNDKDSIEQALMPSLVDQ